MDLRPATGTQLAVLPAAETAVGASPPNPLTPFETLLPPPPTPTRSLDRRPLACRAVVPLKGEEMGRAGAGTNAAHCDARATEPASAAMAVSLVEGLLFNSTV